MTRSTEVDALATERPFPDRAGLAVVVACAGVALVAPWAGWGPAQLLAPALLLALLAGLWALPGTPILFPPLLVLLLLSLFDLVPPEGLIRAASGDAALWALGSLVLSLAARQSGLLGRLFAAAAAPGRLTRLSVVWLALALALLPSPLQAARWSQSFQAVSPRSARAREELLRAARLLARLAWLPAHPASLVAIGLLPAEGLDRYVAMHWLLPVWPLLVLALLQGLLAPWWLDRSFTSAAPPTTGRATGPAMAPAATDERLAMYGVAGIGLSLMLMTLLQPFHGLAPGQMALFGLVMLFALQWVPQGRFHPAVDWSVLVAVGLLPGLISALAVPLPQATASWPLGALALPLLLLLRLCFPPLAAASLAFALVLPWTAHLNADLLSTALPVLVALHIADLLLVSSDNGDRRANWRSLGLAFKSGRTWLWVPAYYLWLGWWNP
ncbi:hypothetical protein PSQ40_05190 [Curvibacter sp. HBC61]|uniref:Uncharacterized protein n=1 Tax=Curvibacter cyanobacteriorum TaxID=3026422 RepID=A0ABT5MVU2_9BURK|nr:hypothetical protein [Curvibacter sp. HBC61]MDD0837962.1 hypothetical protein [Curvibacter sp. HBC61]